ncbi:MULTISPECIES: exostosin domain-containing protein [Hyphobacterium]|uniref:Exostosin family protein n=1 Tax=Hyphobacterium vulgare TaxID=1736751 RepID=A0ABV6ZVM9_9PROT
MSHEAGVTPHVLIVTPVRNGVETLGRTLHSVAALAGPVHLIHHVQDGASEDGTKALLEKWARLAAWGGVRSGCASYRFSWSSSQDGGLYAAIARGFAAHDHGDAQWLGWINADDVLLPGCAGLLAAVDRDLGPAGPSWIGGRVRAAKGGHVVTEHDRPACRAVIQEGLCDGLHFAPIQQEGVFFRRSLWAMIDPDADFARFRLAGDWNLWRAFAARSDLHQIDLALGEFTLRPGQLSAADADGYRAEIERELPFEVRAEAFDRISRLGALRRERLRVLWPEGRVEIAQEPVNWILSDATIRAEERAAYASLDRKPVRMPIRCSGSCGRIVTSRNGAIVSHDADWQAPAETERHAYLKMVEHWSGAHGSAYLGFPWATLIDLQNHWSPRRLTLEGALAEAVDALPQGVRVATVCQHIHARRLVPLMAGAGVTDLFWSHAEHGQTKLSGMTVHSFPLFPVQRAERNIVRRDLLYCFIGAIEDEWYLAKTRSWIFKHLKGRRRGLIVERPSWHYKRAVYSEQIGGEEMRASTEESVREEEFKSALARSLFVLCPSGSGPNTIRIWEAIYAGAIPVILSDRWRPPGDARLWRKAALFFPETESEVRALPRTLARLARDKRQIAAFREAGSAVRERYGPNLFVGDIVDWAAG